MEPEYDVIILGAGISGLSAAKLLHARSLNVLVLEARSRVGGRTYTKRDPDFQYADMGGSYIGPSQKRISKLANELGLNLYKVNDNERSIFMDKGKIMPYREFPRVYNPLALMDFISFWRTVDECCMQVPLSAPWDCPRAVEWDGITSQEFIDRHCWTRFTKASAESMIRMTFAIEPRDMSFLFFLWYTRSGGNAYTHMATSNGAQDSKIVGGSMQVAERIADNLGSDHVMLNKPVSKVTQHDDGTVTVATLGGGSYSCSFVISAVPQALIGRITFSPPLPSLRNQLIQRIPMGSCIKVLLYYKTPFWRKLDFCGDLWGTDLMAEAHDDTKPDGSYPALVGFLNADNARKYCMETPEKRANMVAGFYSKVFKSDEALNFCKMDQHRENLDKLCRLCGGRCTSANAARGGKCAKLCSASADKIMATFHINVAEDDVDTHPQHICHSCYCLLFVSVDKTAPTWRPHPRLGACPVCTNFAQHFRPGRRKIKAKSGGRPRAPPHVRDHFSSLPASPTVSREKILQFEPLSSTAPVECKMCTMLLDNALETPCMHLFCFECLAVQFEISGSTTIPCPDCQVPVHFKEVTAPRGYFGSMFLSLVMKCTACKVSVSVGDINSHTCSHLEISELTRPSFSVFHDHSYATSSKPPTEVTRLLQRPLTAPVTPLMEELGTHILKTKLTQSRDGSTTQYRTGGQPLTTLCVPQPRKCSGDACSSTIRNRSRVLDNTRGLVSMDAKEIQQKDELQLSALRKDLQGILQDLKLNTIRIPAMKLLAVKSHLGISWTRIRELKKWLKGYNILTEGEQALRQQQHDVVADNLFAESLPFSFPDEINGGATIKQAPCVGVKSLVAKVTQQLEEYQKRDQLTWHKGNIPHNEVWVKVGGDKGGGTFKQMIQVGNVERPNSLRHTVVVCAFAAGDTSDNLKTGLRRFRQQVAALQSSTWKSHNIRLFVFGDYEYLCRVYGITGASGRHCCLYCNIKKDDMRLPRGQRPPSQQRTLQSLDNDLQRFKEAGSRLSKAKLFNNVIDEPMFAIPLTQVCPPGLHISLGLYLKHFNSFEGACHDLDMQAAAVLAQKNQEDQVTAALGSGYQKLVSVLKEARQLELQAEALDEEFKLKEDQLTDTILNSEEGSADMEDYIAATKALTEQRERLLAEAGTLRTKAALKPGQGPLAGQLDITLQEFRVQRQAYHGKSFVGNHVHKCCKQENIVRLTNAIIDRTQQVCPSLVPEARTIAAKYAELFHLFGTCHRKYNTSAILDDHAVDALGQDIKNYLAYFRATFPSETVPPKMHLLEDHVIPWIQQWHFGLGFHGEQGGESVHAHLNSLRRDVRGLRDDVAILQSVIRTHWILTSPAHAPATLFD